MSDKSIEVDLTKITETKEHYLNVLSVLEELPSIAFDKSKLSKIDLILLHHVFTEVINDFIFSHKQTFSEHDILTFLNPKLVDLIVKDSELDKVSQVTKLKEPVHKHSKESAHPDLYNRKLRKNYTMLSNRLIRVNERLVEVLESNVSAGHSISTAEEALSKFLGRPIRLDSTTYSLYRDAYQYSIDNNMDFKQVILTSKVDDYRSYRSKRNDAKYGKITMVD